MQSLIIGRKDKADLPELGLENIPIKIDSGAYSCSIHCDSIKEEGNELKVIFLDPLSPNYTGETVSFVAYYKKNVLSSNGEKQERFFVKLELLLFNKNFKADFSLTNRNGLRNPILIGRKILSGNFLIDTKQVNLSYKQKLNK